MTYQGPLGRLRLKTHIHIHSQGEKKLAFNNDLASNYVLLLYTIRLSRIVIFFYKLVSYMQN